MQLVAHAALQRLIDHLMLLDAGLAFEGGGDDGGGVMVAVAAQILDADWASGRPALISRSISPASIAMPRLSSRTDSGT